MSLSSQERFALLLKPLYLKIDHFCDFDLGRRKDQNKTKDQWMFTGYFYSSAASTILAIIAQI
jgi:hypothetical protein